MNKLFVLVGPSAAGKTLISNFFVYKDITILKSIINEFKDNDKTVILENLDIVINNLKKYPFNKIITSTSRSPRENEINGIDYYFYTRGDFESKVNNGDFLEYVENFGNYYGTSLDSINSSLAKGNSIIVLDDRGAIKLKELLKSQVVTIYLDVSVDIMEERMNFRNDDPNSLAVRTTNLHILEYKNKADFVVDANNRIDTVLLDLLKLITSS